MATLSITNAAARSLLDALLDLCDAGSANAAGCVRFYDGTMPAYADTALSGNTQLAELALSNPAFNASSDANPDASATAATITEDSSGDANGSATFARFFDRDRNVVFQGDVGTANAVLTGATATIVAGQPVQIPSFSITFPEKITWTA